MERIKRTSLFSGISQESIKLILSKYPTKTFKAGQVVVSQSQPATEVHIVIEGKVNVYYESMNGTRTTIGYQKAPGIIGELEIFENLPYLGTVTAMEKSKTVIMSREQYLSFLHSNHQICFNLTKILSQLVYDAGGFMRVKFFGQAEHHLAHALLSLAHLEGIPFEGGIKLTRKISKSEFAQILGVARKSVIRAFASLQQEGLIQPVGKELFLPNVMELRRKAFSL